MALSCKGIEGATSQGCPDPAFVQAGFLCVGPEREVIRAYGGLFYSAMLDQPNRLTADDLAKLGLDLKNLKPAGAPTCSDDCDPTGAERVEVTARRWGKVGVLIRVRVSRDCSVKQTGDLLGPSQSVEVTTESPPDCPEGAPGEGTVTITVTITGRKGKVYRHDVWKPTAASDQHFGAHGTATTALDGVDTSALCPPNCVFSWKNKDPKGRPIPEITKATDEPADTPNIRTVRYKHVYRFLCTSRGPITRRDEPKRMAATTAARTLAVFRPTSPSLWSMPSLGDQALALARAIFGPLVASTAEPPPRTPIPGHHTLPVGIFRS